MSGPVRRKPGGEEAGPLPTRRRARRRSVEVSGQMSLFPLDIDPDGSGRGSIAPSADQDGAAEIPDDGQRSVINASMTAIALDQARTVEAALGISPPPAGAGQPAEQSIEAFPLGFANESVSDGDGTSSDLAPTGISDPTTTAVAAERNALNASVETTSGSMSAKDRPKAEEQFAAPEVADKAYVSGLKSEISGNLQADAAGQPVRSKVDLSLDGRRASPPSARINEVTGRLNAEPTHEANALTNAQVPESSSTRNRSCGKETHGNGEEVDPDLPRETTMTLFEFRERIPQAPSGDQQALRDCVRLIEMTGLPPLVFAGLRRHEIVAAMSQYANLCIQDTEIPAGMRAPEKYSRPILWALDRFFENVDGAPTVDVPIVKRLTPEPQESRPAALADVAAKWSPKIIGSEEHGTEPAISTARKQAIETSYWKYVTICRRAGMPLDDMTTLTGITAPIAQELVIKELKTAFGDTTIPSFMSAVKRLFADSLGRNHPNVLKWAANAKALAVSQPLSSKRVSELRGLCAKSDKPTVWEIPGRIAKRARCAKRDMDHDVLLASAVAVAIALDVLAATPAALAGLNLEKEIIGTGFDRALCVEIEGEMIGFPLGEESIDLLDELSAYRISLDRSSEWLFQNFKHGGCKSMSGTLNYVTTAIQAARGSRYTTVDLQDALAINHIDNRRNVSALSDAQGRKSVYSTRARYKLAIDKPLHEK